ncbi:MAG: hypothetical protein ACP5H2_08895 [Solirubrobacteraceae bacterium]
MPVVSIVGVIFAIRYASSTATWLTYLALVAVPVLAAAAVGRLARGAMPLLIPGVLVLFMLAWRLPGSLAGEAAGALLSGLSCVSLGVLLAAVTPPRWLKVGILAMAGADVWLVASQTLQAPNGVLVAAKPAGGWPQLQSEQFGSVSMGYGDLFVAALLGAGLAGRPARQRLAALLTLLFAAAFDVLFLLYENLPATVPVALALVTVELSARFGPWKRAGGIPPPKM